MIDPETQQVFYVDHINHVTTWDDPRLQYMQQYAPGIEDGEEDVVGEFEDTSVSAASSSASLTAKDKGANPPPVVVDLGPLPEGWEARVDPSSGQCMCS